MRYFTIRVLAVAAVAAACTPAFAQQIQFNFNLTPPAGNAAWEPFKNVTLEKEVECYFGPETAQPKVWPAGKTGTFRKKEPLFETPNTLTLQHPAINPQAKGLVCIARILANGQDISATAHQIVYAPVAGNSVKGPLAAQVRIEPQKADTFVKQYQKNKLAQAPKAEQPKAKNPPQTKTEQLVITYSEFRFAGTDLIITSPPKGSTITLAELEKSSADAIKQKFPDRKTACMTASETGLDNNCILRIELTIKRNNTLGELKYGIAATAQNYVTKSAPKGFYDTLDVIFPNGVDTVKVIVYRMLLGNPKAYAPGYCTVVSFHTAYLPNGQWFKHEGPYGKTVCVKA